MKHALRPGMIEAARLIRDGRLADSAALLQRALQGGAAPADTPSTPGDTSMGSALAAGIPRTLRGLFERIKEAGLVPGTGGSAKPAPARPPEEGPQGGRFVTAYFSNPAGSRAYKLYVPGGYRGQRVPLVVMLHGCTQSPDDFAAGTRMNRLAEERTCLVAYPAQAAAANARRCWNWFNPADQQRDHGEPSLIAGITREIMGEYAVDPRHCYVAGLSAGGAAAAVMGRAYPDLYAAIGVHSGVACGIASDVASALSAMRRGGSGTPHPSGGLPGRAGIVPTIVFHGDADTTVNPRNGDQLVAELRERLGTDLETRVTEGRVPGGHAYTRTRHVDAGGRAILEQWAVHGAGHAWSGGDPAGSFTDPQGPDATREMLRFFLAQEGPSPARHE